MKVQGFGSQLWDTALGLEALIASNIADEIGPTLAKGHDYLKKSQIKDNPLGDFESMFRHISKGAWTFSDQDHGWQISDCTAESLNCCLQFSLLPPEIVGEKMVPERLYEAVNVILYLQVRIYLQPLVFQPVYSELFVTTFLHFSYGLNFIDLCQTPPLH
ncbi:hypothetical protein Q3G72_001731 [Acer saccharum]|nr:hypothetical protein Q3G72_001731 [Acer saccharum]